MPAKRPALDSERQFKLALMSAIDRNLRARFRTIAEAAEAAGVEYMRLSRLRRGRHEYFSVNWLFRVAETAQIDIRISVEPLN